MKKIKTWITGILVITLFATLVPLALQSFESTEAYADTPIVIKGLTDTTLTSLRGEKLDADSNYKAGLPVTKVDAGYQLTFHSWNRMVGDKAIEFSTPLTSNDIENSGGITIRMFVHLSPNSPFFVYGDKYGIFLYGLGAGITGAVTDNFIELPRDITQDTWIDFNISMPTAYSLLGSDGILKGIQYGAAIKAGNERSKYFYIGEPKHLNTYIHIESISLREKTTNEDYSDEMYLATTGIGEEPTAEHEKWAGVLSGVNGIYKTDPTWDQIQERSISVIDDDTAVGGRVYGFNFHSWMLTVSTNVIAFNRVLDVSDVQGGMLIRIKAHLSPVSPYYTTLGGIRLLPLDATGKKDEGYMLPGDIIQDSWITLRLSSYEAASLANADGKIYGLQIASTFRCGNEMQSLYVGETTANIKIDYIAVCEETDFTYHNYNGLDASKTVTAITGVNADAYYYYPAERAGYLFGGWYEGDKITDFSGELFDFSASIVEDVDITAHWIKLCSDITSYYGVYTGLSERFTVTEYGIDLLGVTHDYYDECGIGEDGILYLISSLSVQQIELSNYTKKAYKTISYHSFGEKIHTEIYASDETTKAYDYAPIGYSLGFWTDNFKPTSSSNAYNFGRTISANLSLYGYFTRNAASASEYASYYGSYYNTITKDILTLGTFNSASITDKNGDSTTAMYYILSNGGLAFIQDGIETAGIINGVRIVVGGNEYNKLSAYTVMFISDGVVVNTTMIDDGEYKVTLPQNPVRDGLIFKGWYTTMQGGEEFNVDSVVYRNMTLYARWDAAPPQNTSNEKVEESGCNGSATGSSIVGLVLIVLAVFVVRRKRICNS